MYWLRHNYHHFAFIGLLTAFTLVPFGLWVSTIRTPFWFDASSTFRSLGLLAGVMGASLFSLNFILSARLSWIEEALRGLPRVYTFHHYIGIIALILLLTHPLGLGLQYLPYSLELAVAFFLPDFTDIPKLLGMIALVIVATLLWITLFVRIAYHRWKFSHQWLGLALFIASFHVFLIPGHLDGASQLRYYMLSIMLLGLTTYTYRTLLGRWLVRRTAYRVANVKNQQQVTEITLDPVGKPISYLPGQFIFLRISSSSGKISQEMHPFSITSPPQNKQLSIAAKSVGDYTSTLLNMAAGAAVEAEGPYGRFIFSQTEQRQVWIAGGIGITPFISYLRSLKPNNPHPEIQLYYLVTDAAEALFAEELRVKSDSLNFLSTTIWESRSSGRFSLQNAHLKDHQEAEYFICGPASLMTDLKQQLKDRGVPRSKIHLEEFKLY